MPTYQVAYNATTKVATVQPENDALPVGSVNVGTFEHTDEADLLGPDVNHVVYHHVRDLLYKRSAANPANPAMFPDNITDMHNIQINMDVTANPIPVNTVAPAITGTAQVGEVLTVTNGTWTDATSYARQWQRAATPAGPWTNIGAGNTTYTPVVGDIDSVIRCVVTATGPNGTGTANSNVTADVIAA